LVFVDPGGRVVSRVGTGSRLLHDAVQVHGDVFAMAPFEQGQVTLVNVLTREIVARIPTGDHGSPQFLAFTGPRSSAPRHVAEAVAADGWTPESNAADAPLVTDLRRQIAALVGARERLTADHADALRARDAVIEERQQAVVARDAIIAELDAVRARDVGQRDRIIAELSAGQACEIGRRDAMLA